jgi:hypothetical protein
MQKKPARKKTTVALTAAEQAARRRAGEDAMRTGLPVCERTLRHLAAARRKMKPPRYGRAGAFTPPAPAGNRPPPGTTTRKSFGLT